MSKWREVRHGVRRAAGKAISKTGDLSDTASLYLKLARKEAALADFYEQFGRVSYQKYKTDADVDSKMKVLVQKIDIFRAEIYMIKKAIEDKKLAREAEIAIAKEVEESVAIPEIDD